MDEDDEHNTGPNEAARKSLTTFPFSKTTCVCNCGKYNLQELPLLRRILPEGYEYKLCEYLPLDRADKFLVTLRMTLTTQEEALEWKRQFEEKSLTTHVKDKTFPKVERVSIFKAQYRCQFFDRRKTKKKLPEKSKFRDCRSILFINIKKFFKNTVDRHMPTYQTVVRLHYAHDHPLDTADVLKKRQLNEDIKYRFLEMFRQGMKPKDALDKHKRELLQNLGPEKYRQVVCDGYYVPNVPKAYRLYYQIHGKGVSAKTTTKRSSRHNPNPDWIAFQNFPDATPADSDEDCDAVEDEDDAVADESADGGAVDNSGEDEMVQQHLEVGGSCQRGSNHQDGQGSLTSRVCVRDMASTHNNMLTSQNNLLGSEPATDNVAAHNMVPHDGQQLKLNDISFTYSNIPPHNPLYADARGHNLPAQTMPGSSVCGIHLGRDIFNVPQTWENFNITHQQPTAPGIQHQHHHHSLGFQDLSHQNPSTSYMVLPNSGYHNTSNHFVPTQENMDQHVQHQNTITHPVSTVVNIAESNPGHQYSSWNQARSQYHVDMAHVHSQPHVSRIDQLVLPAHTQVSNTRKMPIKKVVKKKKKALKDLNMKHVTKQWMDKKPKVEAETQNLASEVLQTIFLADEAEKLKVRLLTFLTDLESKLMSNPKLFVPGVRHFLNAGEKVEDDVQLVSFLKDFGKTEQSIIKDLETKRKESRENHSTQTRLSGPVFKLGNVKLKSRNVKSGKRKNKAASMNQISHSQVAKTQKSKVIKNSSPPTGRTSESSDYETLGSCKPKQKNECSLRKTIKMTQEHIQKHISTDIMLSACGKQVKKPHTRSFRERPNNSACKQKNWEKCNTKEQVTLEKQNIRLESSPSMNEVPGDVTLDSTDLAKKLIVKFNSIGHTS